MMREGARYAVPVVAAVVVLAAFAGCLGGGEGRLIQTGSIADFSDRDDEVDAIWSTVFRECVTYMMEDAANITACTHYILDSWHLERCGDHACKIAEKVHYKVTGEHIEIK